jgi:hypothetical protein
MPPMPLEYQGRELIGEFLHAIAFRDGRTYRLAFTRMNGQFACETYLAGPNEPTGLLVLTLADAPDGVRISAMTRFLPSLAARSGGSERAAHPSSLLR